MAHSITPSFQVLSRPSALICVAQFTMNVAGFVIGVVTAWETSMQIFEIIDSGKRYGMDSDGLRGTPCQARS